MKNGLSPHTADYRFDAIGIENSGQKIDWGKKRHLRRIVMHESIKASFTESIQIQIAAAEALPDAITHAAQAMVATLLQGNKILCCGNGGSNANVQQFVSCLINQFEN